MSHDDDAMDAYTALVEGDTTHPLHPAYKAVEDVPFDMAAFLERLEAAKAVDDLPFS